MATGERSAGGHSQSLRISVAPSGHGGEDWQTDVGESGSTASPPMSGATRGTGDDSPLVAGTHTRTGPLSFRWRSCRWPVHCRPRPGRRNPLPRLRSPGQPRLGARHTSAARGAGTDGGQQTQRGRHGRLVLTSVDPRIGYRGCRRLRSGAGRSCPRRTRRRLISALKAVGYRGARRYVGHQSDRRDRERAAVSTTSATGGEPDLASIARPSAVRRARNQHVAPCVHTLGFLSTCKAGVDLP